MSENEINVNDSLLRLADVENIIGFKKSKIYKLMHENIFPRPVTMGRRAMRWKASEISWWISGLKKEKNVIEKIEKRKSQKDTEPQMITLKDGEMLIIKLSGGKECCVNRVVDGKEIRTVVGLSEGPVVNSTNGNLGITIQKNTCTIEIKTLDGGPDGWHEKIKISKDQQLVTRTREDVLPIKTIFR